MIMNTEVKITLKEVVIACFKVGCHHAVCLERLGNPMKISVNFLLLLFSA